MSTAASVLSSAQPQSEPVSQLGPSVRIQGKIFSDQDLQIDGKVDGTLEACGHNLTVGSQATVKADIKAQNVKIVGTVEGTIEASDLTELSSECRVVGQIITRRIVIKDGAYFKGNIEIVQPATVVASRPRGADVAVIGMTKQETAEPEGNEMLATA